MNPAPDLFVANERTAGRHEPGTPMIRHPQAGMESEWVVLDLRS